MTIRFKSDLIKYQVLVIAVVLISLAFIGSMDWLVSSQRGKFAWANQIFYRSSFNTNYQGWENNSFPGIEWDANGFTGTVKVGGLTYTGTGGSLKAEVVGSNAKGTGYIARKFHAAPASAYRLSFVWKKNWSGSLKPKKQEIEVFLVNPAGTVTSIWKETTVTNNNTWTLREDVDLRTHITASGQYEIRIRANIDTDAGHTNRAQIWVDEVALFRSIPTDTQAPQAPNELVVSDTLEGGKLALSWDANAESDLAGYHLYRWVENQPQVRVNDLPIRENNFTDSRLTDGTRYYYQVRAVDFSGNESPASLEVSTIPTNQLAPKTPGQPIVGNPGKNQELVISWPANQETDLAGYLLYKGDSPDGPWERVSTDLITDNYFIETNVTEQTTYYYRVQAQDRSGLKSDLSPFGSGRYQNHRYFNLVGNGAFTHGISGWQFSNAASPVWDHAGGFTGSLQVMKRTINGQGGSLLLSVRGDKSKSDGFVWQTFSAQKGQMMRLGLVYKKAWQGNQIQAKKQEFEIRLINTRSGLESLLFSDKALEKAGNWRKVEDLDLSPFLTDDGNYILYIRAFVENEAGTEKDVTSLWLDEVTLLAGWQEADTEPPLPPTGLTVTDTTQGGVLVLNWTDSPSDDVSGYQVYRQTGDGEYSKVTGSLVGETRWIDPGLTNDEVYYYYITAIDWAGNESIPSQTVQGIPTDLLPPVTPVGLTVNNLGTGTGLMIRWRANSESDLAGYRVFRSTDPDGEYLQVHDGLIRDSSYVDGELSPGEMYYYYIIAEDLSGYKSQPSRVETGIPVQVSTFQVIRNGNFATDISGWGIFGADARASWDADGYEGTIENYKQTYLAEGGSLKLEAVGAKIKVQGYMGQTFSAAPGQAGSFSFVWRKNWQGVKAKKHELEILLLTPGGQVNLFRDTVQSNAYQWNVVENIDLSSYMLYRGEYELRIRFFLETESNTAAVVQMWLDEITLTVPSVPETPGGLTIRPGTGTGELHVSWQAVVEENFAGYRLFRSENQLGPFTSIGGGLLQENSYTDSELQPGVTYYYQVAAQNTGGYQSPPSPAVGGRPSRDLSPHNKHGDNPLSCKICHTTHKADSSNLIKYGSYTQVCLTCHDGLGSSYNIGALLRSSSYRHTLANWPPGGSSGQADGVECSDCHNPHKMDGARGLSWSGSVLGTVGVNPDNWKGVFQTPDLVSGVETKMEYQLCFKCHAGGRAGELRNVSKEFNPLNPAYHAVVGPSKSSRLGTYVNGWTSTTPMTCSDCHGDSSDQLRGIHGSPNHRLMIAPYSDKTGPSRPGDLCYRCHDHGTYGGNKPGIYNTAFINLNGKNFHNNPAGHRVPCVQCHTWVTHGFSRPRMLSIMTDPEPYSFGSRNTFITFPGVGEEWKKASCGTPKGIGCH